MLFCFNSIYNSLPLTLFKTNVFISLNILLIIFKSSCNLPFKKIPLGSNMIDLILLAPSTLTFHYRKRLLYNHITYWILHYYTHQCFSCSRTRCRWLIKHRWDARRRLAEAISSYAATNRLRHLFWFFHFKFWVCKMRY